MECKSFICALKTSEEMCFRNYLLTDSIANLKRVLVTKLSERGRHAAAALMRDSDKFSDDLFTEGVLQQTGIGKFVGAIRGARRKDASK